MLLRHLRMLALLLAAPWVLPAGAVDISQKPLIVANPDAVKANLLFILDDSGSMDFDFLPDHTNTALCRSEGATPSNSGKFTNMCCMGSGSSSSSACWRGSAPFSLRGQPPFLAAGFNGAAYDPTIAYTPPVDAKGDPWPTQNSANTSKWTVVKNDAYSVQNTGTINLISDFPDTEWCTDSTFTDCLRNDNYVLPGTVNWKNYNTINATKASGTGWVASGSPDNAVVKGDLKDSNNATARSFGPHYYKIHAAEYCTGPDLRDCRTTAGGTYTVPAPVRWCNSEANATKAKPDDYSCQAIRNSTFAFARYPTKFFTEAGTSGSPARGSSLTFTISLSCAGSRTTGVNSLKISNVEMLTGATTRQNTAANLATQIVAKFDTSDGWKATRSGATITITAPYSAGDKAGLKATLVPTTSGSPCGTFAPTTTPAFSNNYAHEVPNDPGSYPGKFERVDITPGTVTSPNTFPKAATRTDCAGSVCSYDEEMTNFANWWTYYHTRMQAMKTAASLAFGKVGNNRRVGYMSLNNNTESDFLNLDVFEDTSTNKQRSNWFSKLTAAKPVNSTPLRGALSTAGRLYAGAFNKGTINKVTVKEPIEYSCQRNAVILSTDGFWNESGTPKRPDGKTEIGDVDSVSTGADKVPRPKLDGKGDSNTLADVAYYYNNTDLRVDGTVLNSANVCKNATTGADLCNDKDPQNGRQTMMTFTLGLGVSGWMQFSETYLSGGSPDFTAVLNGDTATPSSGTCSWQDSGTCNWPTPENNKLTAVDDLWHAAVNGNGTYFSASNPNQLIRGLSSALQTLDAKLGAAAAATTSNPNVTAGDNQAFVSDFTSSDWFGELSSKLINLDTGRLDTVKWSAQAELNGTATGARKIYMFSGAATNKLKNFDAGEMTTDELAYFQKAWITRSGFAPLTQFCSGPSYCLSTTDQNAAPGKNLVDYLRGDRTNEGDLETPAKFFRARKHVLGDIVNSEAVYVKKQLVQYGDTGYADFNATNRKAMVYVGANDGMLHAFDAETGKEAWAYVPTAVLPNMYKLADKQYATQHQYFVDATPFVQDVQIGSTWHRILVGGLGGGGRAYYALDVTDPENPKALWEFGVSPTDTDANCPVETPRCNMGYTFGQPEIGKLSTGEWVVVVPSGYNNTAPGDGKGRLFVLDVATGTPNEAMSKGIVTGGSGLGHIRAWVEDGNVDNTIQRVYGGDNVGNLWRFDVNNKIGAAGHDAQLLAVLKNTAGTPQPVTSRPELGQVATYAMVYVGTGRYLGNTDLSNTDAQTIYAVKDELSATGHGEVRAGKKFVQQAFNDTAGKPEICQANTSWCNAGDTIRTAGKVEAVNLKDKGGWFIDLPISRERVNNDPLLVLGTLVVISNVVQPGDVCSVGGSSWVNYFDYTTGAATSVALGSVLASRPTVYRLPNQKLVGLARDSSGGDLYFNPPTGPQVGTTRRISWRDLQQQ